MLLVTSKLKPLDKLWLLWAICFFAHRREHGLSCSYGAIKNDYGDEVAFIWETYRDMAMNMKFMNADPLELTERGLIVVADWERINRKLFDF